MFLIDRACNAQGLNTRKKNPSANFLDLYSGFFAGIDPILTVSVILPRLLHWLYSSAHL